MDEAGRSRITYEPFKVDALRLPSLTRSSIIHCDPERGRLDIPSTLSSTFLLFLQSPKLLECISGVNDVANSESVDSLHSGVAELDRLTFEKWLAVAILFCKLSCAYSSYSIAVAGCGRPMTN